MPKNSLIKRAIEQAEDKWDAGKEKFEEIQDSTVSYIKKNPVKSVAIALGIGAVIGAGIAIGVNAAMKARERNQSFWSKYNPFS